MIFRIECIDKFITEKILQKEYIVLKNDEERNNPEIKKMLSLKNCNFQYSTYYYDNDNKLQRRYYHLCDK